MKASDEGHTPDCAVFRAQGRRELAGVVPAVLPMATAALPQLRTSRGTVDRSIAAGDARRIAVGKRRTGTSDGDTYTQTTRSSLYLPSRSA